MKKYLILFLLFPFHLSAQTETVSDLLQSQVIHSGKNKVHSILFYLEKPEEQFLFQEGFGLDKKKGTKVAKDAQFKIASITKTFVATIIMQLMEEGKFQLDEKIYDHLESVDFLNIENFHFHQKEAFAKAITIEHLLSHRSGLADIFNDKATRFFLGVYFNKKKKYSPEKIVKKYFQFKLNKEAHFKPGEDFYYSDMNYVLLGLLIQQIEKMPLAEVIRKRILQPLQMKNTFFEFYESPVGNLRQVHQYQKKIDMTKLNTSFDWAGGGLVSTTHDLAIFIKALFDGQIINEISLQKMTTTKFTNEYNNPYGFGFYESKYNGDTYFGHYGAYGSYLGYCPEKKITLAYNISQSVLNFSDYKLVNQVLKLADSASQ